MKLISGIVVASAPLAMFITGCTSYEVGPVSVRDVSEYSNTAKNAGVAVAAELLSDPEKIKEGFDVNLAEKDFYPVQIVIKNDTDGRLLLTKDSIELSDVAGNIYSEEAKRPLSHTRRRLVVSSDNWVIGAVDDQRLVGVVRLVRSEGKKERHKASVFSMYVAPSSRRRGVARKLLDLAISRAKRLKGVRVIQLTAVTSNIAAMALYEEAGFVEYGREEKALLVAGRFYSETLMAKGL